MKRYATWDDVLDYCVYSANPVGRLVLYLCDYRDEERQRLSDHTCTALQLANFWQDVSRDIEKGRIYIPLDALAAHGLTERDIVARRFDERYVALMKISDRGNARLFTPGLPLTRRVDGTLRIDIELFSRGGLAILDAIEARDTTLSNSAPRLRRWTKLRLLGRALASQAFSWRACAADSARRVAALRRGKPSIARDAGEPLAPAAQLARSPRPTRSATGLRARRAAAFTWRFTVCERKAQRALRALCFHALVDNVSDEPGDMESKRSGLARWRAMLDEAVAGADARPRDSSGAGGHDLAVRDSDALFSRFDSGRGNGFDGRVLRDVRPPLGILLSCGGDGRTYLPARFWFSRSAFAGSRRAAGAGVSDDEYHSRRARRFRDGPRLFAAGGSGPIRLPREELRGPVTPQLRELLEFEADRAWRFYEEGAPLVRQVDADSRATLWALGAHLQQSTGANRRARIRRVFFARIVFECRKKFQYLLTAGRMRPVENGCPRKAFW